MFYKLRKVILLFFIILIAWFFRFNNVNWDSGYHLHPDERFLTMVSTSMKLPVTISEYLNQKISLLNPANIGYKFFVYGNFPLVINKYLAMFLKMDDYNQLTLLGRQLSGFFDLLIVILVFKTVFLLTGRHPERPKGVEGSKKRFLDFARNDNIALWAAFVYAISVLPIQLSHFFTVDTFLNFFMFGSFYFALRYSVIPTPSTSLRAGSVEGSKKRFLDFARNDMVLSAIFFGLALTCKITAIFILPLILIFQIGTYIKRSDLIKYVLSTVLFFLVAYFTLRLANPYYFQNASFLNPTPNKLFVENIQSLKNMTVKSIDNWFPPMVQWLNKNSVIHSLVNNIVFGFGIVPTIFLIIGILKILLSFPRRRESIPIFIILFWVIGLFVYQSLQTTPTLRYFIILYPFFAIFAGIGINTLIHVIARNHQPSVTKQSQDKRLLHFVRNDKILIAIIVILLLTWPIMFSSIYFHKNTRVEASEWIYKNLPNNSYILSESWDDSLPLSVANNYGKQFTGEQLPIFDPDTAEKWQKINESLEKADYYILSSNRGWGSIPTVPQKYPLMSKFYSDLLANKNIRYKKIKEFTSYPSLKYLGISIEIPDQWSDESFTVYDHQKVLIYKNVKKS